MKTVKLSIFLSLFFTLFMLSSAPSYADDTTTSSSTSTTTTPASSTTNSSSTSNSLMSTILNKLNQTPAYVEALTEMAKSWIDTDDKAKIIANNQADFSALTNNYTTAVTNQINTAKNITSQYMQGSSTSTPMPTNANDLTYSILYSMPIVTTNSTDFTTNMQNYIANASGAHTGTIQPANITTSSSQKQDLINYYNTVVAIQSFDAYAVSGLYHQQGSDATSASLISRASDPTNWFQVVATESLGLVLRDILMYSSQTYVQITRLVQLQEKQLAILGMTNTLLIMSLNSFTGDTLTKKALNAGR